LLPWKRIKKETPKEQTFPQTQKCRAHTSHTDSDVGTSQYQARTDIAQAVCGTMSCHEELPKLYPALLYVLNI